MDFLAFCMLLGGVGGLSSILALKILHLDYLVFPVSQIECHAGAYGAYLGHLQVMLDHMLRSLVFHIPFHVLSSTYAFHIREHPRDSRTSNYPAVFPLIHSQSIKLTPLSQ